MRSAGAQGLRLGLLTGLPGIGLGVIAVVLDERLLGLPTAVLLGAGHGMTKMGGLARVSEISSDIQRPAVTSAFLVMSFVGYAGVPYLAVALIGPLGPEGASTSLAALVVASLLIEGGPINDRSRRGSE